MHGGTAVGGPEDGAADERTGSDEEARQGLLRFGDDGELTLERLASAPQQSLDRADLNALMIRDLLVGPPGALAHGKHVTVSGRQAVERPVHQFSVDRGEHELFRRVVSDNADRLLRGDSRSSVGVLRDRRRSMSVQMLPAITVSHG